MVNTYLMRRSNVFALLLCIITLHGCITDQAAAPSVDGEESMTGGMVSTIDEGGVSDESMSASSDSLGGTNSVSDSNDTVPNPPPPPPGEAPCDRFCSRMNDCLFPTCDALSDVPPDQFCRGWCGGGQESQEWLYESADLSCEDFNARIYGFSPEIRALCTIDDPDSTCNEICDFGEVCGLVSDDCLSNCNGTPLNDRLCFLGATDL